jgi:hypothetical protein
VGTVLRLTRHCIVDRLSGLQRAAKANLLHVLDGYVPCLHHTRQGNALNQPGQCK